MSDASFQTARDIRDAVSSGRASAVEVVQAALSRIESTNPALNAFLSVVGERALERSRPGGGDRDRVIGNGRPELLVGRKLMDGDARARASRPCGAIRLGRKAGRKEHAWGEAVGLKQTSCVQKCRQQALDLAGSGAWQG